MSPPRGAMDWSVIVAYPGDTYMVIENRMIYVSFDKYYIEGLT